MSSPLSMRQLAALANVSQSTVSLALRQHPSIPESTRRKIERLAAKHGYQPNAMVSSVLGSVRRKNERKWNFAWLNAADSRRSIEVSPLLAPVFQGAQKRAQQLGCSLDPFWMRDPGFSGSRLTSILHARGIDGAIYSGKAIRKIDAGYLSKLKIVGHNLFDNHDLHRTINSDITRNTEMLILGLKHRGFLRIGLLISVESDMEFGGRIEQTAAKFIKMGVEIFSVDGTTGRVRARYSRWLEQFRPEVIASTLETTPSWCLATDGTRKLYHLFASTQREQGPASGIDPRFEAIGGLLIDDLVAQQNQKAGSEEFTETLVRGRWVEPDPSLS